MGAAESKPSQEKAKLGGTLPGSVETLESSARMISPGSGKENHRSSKTSKRGLDGSLAPGYGHKKRRLSTGSASPHLPDDRTTSAPMQHGPVQAESSTIRKPPDRVGSPTPGWSASFPILNRDSHRGSAAVPASSSRAENNGGVGPSCEAESLPQHDQAGCHEIDNDMSAQPSVQSRLPTPQTRHNQPRSSGQSGLTMVPDLGSQLAEVSPELREALVSLRDSTDESMLGWTYTPASSLSEAQWQSNQLIVRRAIESLSGLHHASSFSAVSLQQSTTTVDDCAIPGDDRYSSEEVETSFLEPAEGLNAEGGTAEHRVRSGKRRRSDDQTGDGRKHKRRRRSTGVDQYTVQTSGRLRKLVGLWRKDGRWSVLRGEFY